MSKRSRPSGASNKQKTIVKEINEKKIKIITALPKLTEDFSTIPPKEERVFINRSKY